MTRKIFRSISMVAGLTLLVGMVVVAGILYNYFGQVSERQLEEELVLAAQGVAQGGEVYLHSFGEKQNRLTWVDADGNVRYDTHADRNQMENHLTRQEIAQALQTGSGRSERVSSTLMEKTIYVAKRLDDGSVLRISMRQAAIGKLVLGMILPLVMVFLLAMLFSLWIAKKLSLRIVQPLNALDLGQPLENDTYEELTPMLTHMSRQQAEINEQMRLLSEQREQFLQITSCMSEGLVLLNSRGVILSINDAACRLFDTDQTCVDKDFLVVERCPDMTQAIDSAMRDGHSELRFSRDARQYQAEISRVSSGEAVHGVVLLVLDITDHAQLEMQRREFTANVSHELKTPLQTLIGSTELIENGLVKPEDMAHFAATIRHEAQRLVNLINDIIQLSQLDEGMEMPREMVDLRKLSDEAADALHMAAGKAQVSLQVMGQAQIFGVRSLLDEIIFNLTENAIRYNKPGGTVLIRLSEDDQHAEICVSDTGIGIPKEHQSRIFERFYRVDKSHSRASGGTGLGLSIVKHAVMYHGGNIALESSDKGTVVTVTIPKKS